ncbi:phosphomannomutase [Alkalimonas sp. MEB108]|uniref:Phosphomannomutase n=1 Tax=Alkalimonas cellulosilytica TaxID=3058395 RepID=A0ABU7J1M6_9GAMM|nr:phosphomannomutase [Alkalimonas sp. MEB108]MEE2000421.1 phosphomannomutase [Alkalimonas sp. MEB108]
MFKPINEILAESPIAFGTSGARGLVSDFSDDVCAAFTQSFIRCMQQDFAFSKVAIGIDNRPSSQKIAAACMGLLKVMGLKVDYYGVLPTPALAFKALNDKVPAIMVTGSHIPFDRNGLKFYRPDGEISKKDEQAIVSVSEALLNFNPEFEEQSTEAEELYMQRYLSVFPSDLLQGKRIGIYEHSSAGRDLYYKVFEALGADVLRLERTTHFVPIDTEAVSESDQLKARQWSEQFEFDAIFTTDGDGDRPLVADEKGNWLRGDTLGILTARELGISALAVPVSSSTAIELSGFFAKVVRTKIGSPYVIEAFSKLDNEASYAGFEANGGFLLGSSISYAGQSLLGLPTRDALLPALAVFAAAKNQTISTLVLGLPKRFTASDRLQDVSAASSHSFIQTVMEDPSSFVKQLALSSEVEKLDTTDGLRLELASGDIIHLRPSGNAPELRCYVDTDDASRTYAILRKAMDCLLANQ